MSEELYPYYENELLFLRQMAQEFAGKYPLIAGRLLLEPHRSADPHVERLIESVALIGARIHRKLDDEFPELTDSMLSVLYPHYLAPVPSATVVQFQLDSERTQLPEGMVIPAGSRLASQRFDGVPLRFRTCYPVTLWPISLTHASLSSPPFTGDRHPPAKAQAAIRLRLECTSALGFPDLALGQLRFFLHGTDFLVSTLYELILNHAVQVSIGPAGSTDSAARTTLVPAQVLSPVGFGRDEAMLPYPNRSFMGYRLLTEFFSFREKFWFFDLSGWKEAREKGLKRDAEVVIYLDRGKRQLEQIVNRHSFRLGCSPAVNLFERTAEPITLSQTRFEYRVVPDVSRPDGMEVYSVDAVSSTDPVTKTTKEYQPFYSFHHGQRREERKTFWYASRRAKAGDRATDVFLNLVDLGFAPQVPAESTLLVKTTCTNGNLPARIQQNGQRLAFQLEGAAPLSGIECLVAPTESLHSLPGRGAHWRLVSHLNLNHLSLTNSEEGKAALQAILRLYAGAEGDGTSRTDSAALLIDGIRRLESRRVTARRDRMGGESISRGIEITIEFEEENYRGASLFLFASVLERFLALYTSLNSFTQMVAKITPGGSLLKRWPPRAGEQPFL